MRTAIISAIAVFTACIASTPTKAADIFVADEFADLILRVDSETGEQTIVSSGGELANGFGIALSGGAIYVSNQLQNRVFRIDPDTGAQTVISSEGLLNRPHHIAADASGNILVANRGGNNVLRIDPTTGAQTIVSSGGNFSSPFGIAVDASGNILIADDVYDDRPGGPGAVIRVDPVTGNQTVVSTGAPIFNPLGVAVEASGDILIADADAFDGSGGVIRINPVSGAQTVVSRGGAFFSPFDIAVEASGDILVVDRSTGLPVRGQVIRVNPVSGAQSVLSSAGNFQGPQSIVVGDPLPICDIQMSKSVYDEGKTVTAQVLRIANPAADPVAIELKIWLGIDGSEFSLVNDGSDGRFVLPAGFDTDVGPLDLGGNWASASRSLGFRPPVTPAHVPKDAGSPGSYEFSCRILDPVTGKLLSEDRNSFEIE